MGEVSKLATDIELKIEKLLELYKKSKAENEELKEENNKLQKDLLSQINEIEELNKHNKLLQIAKSIKTVEGKTEIKLKINELVREIDNCIALLNR